MQNTYMDGETVTEYTQSVHKKRLNNNIRKFQTQNSSVIDSIFEQHRKYILNNKQAINVTCIKL